MKGLILYCSLFVFIVLTCACAESNNGIVDGDADTRIEIYDHRQEEAPPEDLRPDPADMDGEGDEDVEEDNLEDADIADVDVVDEDMVEEDAEDAEGDEVIGTVFTLQVTDNSGNPTNLIPEETDYQVRGYLVVDGVRRKDETIDLYNADASGDPTGAVIATEITGDSGFMIGKYIFSITGPSVAANTAYRYVAVAPDLVDVQSEMDSVLIGDKIHPFMDTYVETGRDFSHGDWDDMFIVNQTAFGGQWCAIGMMKFEINPAPAALRLFLNSTTSGGGSFLTDKMMTLGTIDQGWTNDITWTEYEDTYAPATSCELFDIDAIKTFGWWIFDLAAVSCYDQGANTYVIVILLEDQAPDGEEHQTSFETIEDSDPDDRPFVITM